MKKVVVTLLVAMLFLGVAFANGTEESSAGKWPSEAITLNVTGKAGGSTDLVGRVFAKFYGEELGVPVVVTNGDGIIQYQGTHDAEPDGYTICIGAMGFLLYGHTGTLDFGLEGYDPICVASEDETFGLYIMADSPYKTLDELVAYMKANPGKVSMGMKTSTSVHLEIVGFLKAVGCEANVVDSGADAARVTALLGHQIDVTVEPYGTMKSYLEEGTVICLGTFQKESCFLCPDIPTVYQQGYDFTFPSNFQAVMLPLGCDPEVVKLASEAAQRVLDNPDYVKEINSLGAIVNSRNYEECNAYLQNANATVSELVVNIL